MKEEWKDIEGYEGFYQVSNKGRVKSVERKVWDSGKQSYNTIKERILKPGKDGYGYLKVDLCKYGQPRSITVHRLVATAFLDNPKNLPQINHIDENKENNCVNNLEWCTSKYNNNHGTRTERAAKTISKPVLAISKDKKSYLYFNSIMDAERLGGFNHSSISLCCRGERKTHKGYTWSFVE